MVDSKPRSKLLFDVLSYYVKSKVRACEDVKVELNLGKFPTKFLVLYIIIKTEYTNWMEVDEGKEPMSDWEATKYDLRAFNNPS